MPLNVIDQGQNNEVHISAEMRLKGSGTIMLQGSNNKVVIKDSQHNFSVYIILESNCTLRIGVDINCGNLVLYQARDAVMEIGANVGFNGMVRMMMHEPARLSVGDGCLFGDQVEVTTSDMHSIVDARTKERLNPAKDVEIGNRVWIGTRALIMKGVSIGEGAVIGAMSVVARNIPANCVAAGNPARVVRENATWDFVLR